MFRWIKIVCLVLSPVSPFPSLSRWWDFPSCHYGHLCHSPSEVKLLHLLRSRMHLLPPTAKTLLSHDPFTALGWSKVCAQYRPIPFQWNLKTRPLIDQHQLVGLEGCRDDGTTNGSTLWHWETERDWFQTANHLCRMVRSVKVIFCPVAATWAVSSQSEVDLQLSHRVTTLGKKHLCSPRPQTSSNTY